jgi:4-hydroxy-tetrahydrodipicolinate reductase
MATKPVKLIVGGAGGRMGQTILSLANSEKGLSIAGAFERSDHQVVGRDVGELIGTKALNVPVHPDIRECIKLGNVVIDFTHPQAVGANVDAAVDAKRGIVIGTTGLTKTTLEKIRNGAHKVPIVQAPNMSVGVNLLFKVVSLVGEALDDQYDVEIVEEHHRHKKDAPSGTALELARIIARARGINLERNTTHGRKGLSGARKRGSIGIHAVRGGDTVGVHVASFIGDGERVEFTHKASSRQAFAHGALVAAKFVAQKKSGFYNMQDVLGL